MISNRIPTRTRSPRAESPVDPNAESLRVIAESLKALVALLKSPEPAPKPKKMSQDETIAWLISRIQGGAELPSMSDISRLTGISRRQLSADRWPKFHDLYQRLAGMDRGIDKARTADCHHDNQDDE